MVRTIRTLGAVLLVGGLSFGAAATVSADPPRPDAPAPIARGPRVSGVAQPLLLVGAGGLAGGKGGKGGNGGGGGTPTVVSCSTPGVPSGGSIGNYKTNCHGTGRPVNETTVATNGTLFVAGANDYNSYNGIVQDGFYWSSDGKQWNDAGPLNVFPQQRYNAAGDPGVAVDTQGVVYYSSLLFNYYKCNVGGVELLRGTSNGTSYSWTYDQIAADSASQFQDKPAVALDSSYHQVFVSWTQFQSCSGSGVASPIRVAIFPDGAASTGPSQELTVPGSTYSQGSSIQPDGAGGFWLAWEEYSNATSAATESVKLAHWQPSGGWSGAGTAAPTTISPTSYTDLPSPLPGFAFRDNSFPVLAVVGGQPWVAWTSYDSRVGRTYLSIAGSVPSGPLSNGTGDQFFPAISAAGSGGPYVSFSQANGPYTAVSSTNSYDQWVVPLDASGSVGSPWQASTAASYPNLDQFFSGKFIGDYNGMTVSSSMAYPIWTDIRGPDPNYPGYEMDSMVAAP
jgi:hypothetical protein